MVDTSPIVIAHRTCPCDAEENSLQGIKQALAAGADAVEFDVRLTRDGVAVLLHDAFPWRTLRWPLPVRRTTYATLCAAAGRRRIQQPPQLADALRAIIVPAAPVIDVKANDALDQTLETLLEQKRFDAHVWSRDPSVVRTINRRTPQLSTALLRNTASRRSTTRYLQDAVRAAAGAVSLHQGAVTPEAVRAGHDSGLTVYAWVIDPSAHERILDCGVDGVVTDWPAAARQALLGRQ